MSIIDDAALDQRIREVARQEAERPAMVNQRTVEAIVGLPRGLYLELARERAFPATKVQRLVVARTVDVLTYFEGRLRARGPGVARASRQERDAEARLARAGFRRVVPIGAARPGGRS